MLRLKKIINYNTVQNLFRSYVSLIDIHVDKVKAVKIKPEFDSNDSDSEIKIEIFDGENNLIKVDTVATVQQSEKKFTLDSFDTKDDMTITLELPINVLNDAEIKASAVKGHKTKFSYRFGHTKCDF